MVAELILRNSTSSSSSSSSFPPAKQSSQCSESSKSSKGLRPFTAALCHLAPPGERPKGWLCLFLFSFSLYYLPRLATAISLPLLPGVRTTGMHPLTQLQAL